MKVEKMPKGKTPVSVKSDYRMDKGTGKYRWFLDVHFSDGTKWVTMKRNADLHFDNGPMLKAWNDYYDYEWRLKYLIESGQPIGTFHSVFQYKQFKCRVCEDYFVYCGENFGSEDFPICFQHKGMRLPTAEERRVGANNVIDDLNYEHPLKPPFVGLMQLFDTIAEGSTSNDVYPVFWQDARGYYDGESLDTIKLRQFDYDKQRRIKILPEDFMEVPYTRFGDYSGVGDDVTRHNFEYWAKKYADTMNVTWLKQFMGYGTYAIVIRNSEITQEQADAIGNLVSGEYCLDFDTLHQTQERMQDEAWDSWIQDDDWKDIIAARFKEKFETPMKELYKDVDKSEVYQMLKTAFDKLNLQTLFFDLAARLGRNGSGDEWTYENNTALIDLEEVAEQLQYEDILPPKEKQPMLSAEMEAYYEEA